VFLADQISPPVAALLGHPRVVAYAIEAHFEI
jgi:hypothetical protein